MMTVRLHLLHLMILLISALRTNSLPQNPPSSCLNYEIGLNASTCSDNDLTTITRALSEANDLAQAGP